MRRLRQFVTVLVAVTMVSSAVGGVAAAGVGQDTATAGTAAESAQLVYEGESISLDAAEGQTIRGTSNFSAGTELTVYVGSNSGESRFLRWDTVTVDENGTFEATFDMSDVESGTEFDVDVLRGYELVAEGEGTVGAESAAEPNATIEEPGTHVWNTGADAVAGTTNLPAGEELAVELRDSEGNLVAERVATVDDNGSFAVPHDFSRHDGETLNVTVSHDGDVLDRTTTRVAEADAELDQHHKILWTEPGQTISGTTNFADGNVTLIFRDAETGNLLFERPATVEGGQFEKQLDLSNVDTGEFQVTVSRDGTTLNTSYVVVVEPTAEIDQAGSTIWATTNRTITGTTNVADVENVTVTVRTVDAGPADGGYVLAEQRTAVDNGEFAATVDLRNLATAPVNVTVSRDDRTLTEARLQMTAPSAEIDERSLPLEAESNYTIAGTTNFTEDFSNAENVTLEIHSNETGEELVERRVPIDSGQFSVDVDLSEYESQEVYVVIGTDANGLYGDITRIVPDSDGRRTADK